MADELEFPDVSQFGMGWVDDQTEVNATLAAWEGERGGSVQFTDVAPHLMDAAADDDAPVFIHYGRKTLNLPLAAAWNQGSAGTCVGHGHTEAAEELAFWEVACGEAEDYPDADFAVEPTYAGSRVEVGGGRISGDGSVGVWAGEWAKKWGFVKRGLYGSIDLRSYSIPLCRQWGSRGQGVPAEIETLAKQHPVTDVALVVSAEEGWAALGSGKPIPVCSNVGYQSPMDSDGFCARSGNWAHCMLAIARFRHPRRGRSVVLRNSWGDYLRAGTRQVDYVDTDGKTKQFELPPGYFCITLSDFGSMLGQRDSVAYAGFAGWKKVTLDYLL